MTGVQTCALPIFAGHILAHDGDDLGDALEGGQHGFDLAQLDTVAAHLHLVIQTSQVLQRAVVVPAPAVAGAVGTTSDDMCRLILFRMILDEIIRNETIFGEFRTVQVAQRNTFAGDALATPTNMPTKIAIDRMGSWRRMTSRFS